MGNWHRQSNDLVTGEPKGGGGISLTIADRSLKTSPVSVNTAMNFLQLLYLENF